MGEKFDRYLERMSRGVEKRVDSGDVTIAGSGHLKGGVYGSVKASGSLKVSGDLEAEEFKVSGSVSVDGSVKAEVVKVSGAASIHGDLRGESIRVAGALSVDGEVRGDEVKVSGGLKAEEVSGDSVRLSGSFKVGGPVKGDYVEVVLSGDSEAESLEGEDVYVSAQERRVALAGLLFRRRGRPRLKVGRVKAERLYVRGVVVEGDVEAERVVLEDGAEVKGKVSGEVVRR